MGGEVEGILRGENRHSSTRCHHQVGSKTDESESVHEVFGSTHTLSKLCFPTLRRSLWPYSVSERDLSKLHKLLLVCCTAAGGVI